MWVAARVILEVLLETHHLHISICDYSCNTKCGVKCALSVILFVIQKHCPWKDAWLYILAGEEATNTV